MSNINKKTLAIIVTYNRLNFLKECINALVNSIEPCDILVVNNHSTDDTKKYLLFIDKIFINTKFYIFNLDVNLNGAGGYNFGLKEAMKLDYRYFWLMDDDCIVNENSLKELVSAANRLGDNFGFLSSKVLWKDGNICKTNIQRKSVARKINDFTSDLVNVDFCSFVSCFVKKKDALKVGLPIKEFIIWTDDLEWTRRLTYKKINPDAKEGYLCNKSIVIHKCAYNYGVTIVRDTDERFPRYKYIYRNDVYCFKREGIRGHLYMLIRNLYHIISILLFSKNNKIKRIKVLINGYIDGYKFNPQIEYVLL